MKYDKIKSWLDGFKIDQISTAPDHSMPKITVITPSYNQGQFIEDTIKSVLAQKYPNLEYIVYDGGSTDNTVNILEQYAPYLDHWESVQDKGQSDGINKGFKRATGDIICWLNSDDLFMPDTLHFVAEQFSKGKVDFIYGKSIYLFESMGKMLQNNTTNLRNHFDITDCDFFVQPSTFWSKSVLDKVGLLSEHQHYCFDWEWFIRVKDAGFKMEYVDKNFSVYRIHEDHKSSAAGQKRIIEISKLYEELKTKEVAQAYLKINGSSNRILVRRVFKRMPAFISYFYWKLSFADISFHDYRSILQM